MSRAIPLLRLSSGLVLLSMWSWNPAHAASPQATIIDTATGCAGTVERTDLAGQLTTAGYTVNTITTGIVPASLSGQQQVWDIRCTTVLAAGEITTYTTYLSGGGSLFLMGENLGFAGPRDASLVSFIATLGGGSLTVATSLNTQNAQPPFNVNGLSVVTFRAIGGTTSAGTGSFVTKDQSDNNGGSLVFSPGSMSNATAGTLIIVFDVNFLDNNRSASETQLTANLISYLAAPTTITETPAPPTLLLALMGGMAVLVVGWRRVRRLEAGAGESNSC